MKKWYIYFSKQGTTEKCGKYLKEKNNDVILWNLREGNPEGIAVGDEIVVASGLYVGKINKKVISFIKENREPIAKGKTVIVVCGALETDYLKSINKNLGEDVKNFDEIIYAGYAYDLGKMNFLERTMIKKIAEVTSNEEHIRYEELDKLLE